MAFGMAMTFRMVEGCRGPRRGPGESRGLWECRLRFGKCPVEPGSQRLDIAELYSRSAPNAQTGRRIPIESDIEGDAFLLEQTGQGFGEGSLIVDGQTHYRRVHDLEAHGRIRALVRIFCEMIDPCGHCNP